MEKKERREKRKNKIKERKNEVSEMHRSSNDKTLITTEKISTR